MKMNNKGFTLVELLAVITILLSLSIVVVTNVSASLKRNDEQEKEAQEMMIKNAAKIYFSLKNSTSILLSDLVAEGYIDIDMVDKIDGIEINNGKVVSDHLVCIYDDDYNIFRNYCP